MKKKFLFRKTKRLLLRPLEVEDYEVWKEANLNMLDSRNLWDLGRKSKDELTKSYFKKFVSAQAKNRNSDTFYSLAIFDKQGSLIGVVSIMEVARRMTHTAYLGYRIFNNYWGMGYGYEAVKAMIEIGFDDLNLHRLEAGIEHGNKRSIRLAKSLGMRREGVKKRALFFRDKWVDIVMYTLTSEDVGKKFDTSSLKRKPSI